MPWFVERSERDPETRYVVHIPESDDEPFYCDCEAFTYAKGRFKTCKHIRRLLKRLHDEAAKLSATRTKGEESERSYESQEE